MRFLLSELADELGAKLVGDDRTITGLSIDSRTVEAGQLFVPLVAERNGHAFIAAAIGNGATAYLAAEPIDDDDERLSSASRLEVADTEMALTAVGVLARNRMAGTVVGITGSVGKTSVKDLTAAACAASARTWASRASFNNELGVPLTLANAPDETEVAVVEMGSRGIGHIAELCRVARPTVGLVTCVALAHSELFGSIEAVARGKGELVEAVPADGTAVLNADDPNVMAMADRTVADVLTFGLTDGADVKASAVSLDGLLRPRFTLMHRGDKAELTLQVRGAHMASNAAAAVAAALAAGVEFDDAVRGVADARLSPWRMEVSRAQSGLLVINDAYNANPTSMRAAMRSLVEVDAADRVAVVGLMAELGDEGPAEHLAITREAEAAGIRLIAVSAPEYGPSATHVDDIEGARSAVGDLGSSGAVLVKGSRVAGLEALAEALLGS